MKRDAYAVLGVARDADDETIASAFRTLARRFHPDIAGNAATRRMMVINAAYDAIRTAESRAGYEGTADPSAPAPAPAQPTTSATSGPDIDGRDRPRWTPERDGTGGAGSPPGRPTGSVLDFGRHIGWSLGEVARVDPGYLVWLTEKPEGRPYLEEIDAVLQRSGYRPDPATARDRRPGQGVFHRP